LQCGFSLCETYSHIQLGSGDVFPKRESRSLEFGGNEWPFDVFILWAFPMDQKLNLIRTMSPYLLAGFTIGG
jgi:hypothetical protein